MKEWMKALKKTRILAPAVNKVQIYMEPSSSTKGTSLSFNAKPCSEREGEETISTNPETGEQLFPLMRTRYNHLNLKGLHSQEFGYHQCHLIHKFQKKSICIILDFSLFNSYIPSYLTAAVFCASDAAITIYHEEITNKTLLVHPSQAKYFLYSNSQTKGKHILTKNNVEPQPTTQPDATLGLG